MVDTITSGRVVPMDTTVAPMSSSGRPNRRAMPVAPSTTLSPLDEKDQPHGEQKNRDNHTYTSQGLRTGSRGQAQM